MEKMSEDDYEVTFTTEFLVNTEQASVLCRGVVTRLGGNGHQAPFRPVKCQPYPESPNFRVCVRPGAAIGEIDGLIQAAVTSELKALGIALVGFGT